MTRLLVHVEGQTEESFVNEILAPHLCHHGYSVVSARLVGNTRQRGGIRGWDSVRRGITHHLKEDLSAISTTMVDFYALPQSGTRAWPGRAEAARLPYGRKAATVISALLADIVEGLGPSFDSSRFVPFVMMHEFEALLFSDCERFGRAIGQPTLIPRLQEIRDAFASPEEINDSPTTAPSKRIEALIPEYQKPLLGCLAVLEIGLDRIRAECPIFRSWIDRLEKLPRKI